MTKFTVDAMACTLDIGLAACDRALKVFPGFAKAASTAADKQGNDRKTTSLEVTAQASLSTSCNIAALALHHESWFCWLHRRFLSLSCVQTEIQKLQPFSVMTHELTSQHEAFSRGKWLSDCNTQHDMSQLHLHVCRACPSC